MHQSHAWDNWWRTVCSARNIMKQECWEDWKDPCCALEDDLQTILVSVETFRSLSEPAIGMRRFSWNRKGLYFTFCILWWHKTSEVFLHIPLYPLLFSLLSANVTPLGNRHFHKICQLTSGDIPCSAVMSQFKGAHYKDILHRFSGAQLPWLSWPIPWCDGAVSCNTQHSLCNFDSR